MVADFFLQHFQRNNMFKVAVLFLLPVALFAQQLVYEFKIDTAKYDSYQISTNVVPHPNINAKVFGPSFIDMNLGNTYLWCQALKLKNSNQYDIYALEGKEGTVTINIPSNAINCHAIISQTILDNDNGWEYILNYVDTITGHWMFTIIDDNNAVLLSDSGSANYGFDGQNTYVISYSFDGSYKVWKFRSNVSSTSPGLAKTSASAAPIMALMPSGNFRINLAQSSNGQTSIQLFDMLGRLVFAKNIQDMKTQTSYVIPSTNIPKSPFMTKVNNGNGVFYQKEIPAH
jgi:hypothetical protein